MSDEPAETFSADAVRWIDGLSDPSGLRGSWRLQMLEHRVTVKETGVDPETGVKTYSREMRPVRLVRFAKGCPWALVPEAERYLLSLAPYTGKIVNGVDIPGTYKPTRTRWIRDDQTNLDDPRRSTNENRHTLVQDLVEASAADGDSVPQSSDCVETVVAEYHWDEPSLPEAGDLPAASQGTTVSVQQVSRQEDGTYRYAIVTRTAKTRVGAEATVECTAFQSVTQQDFVNLYGDPETGFEDEAGHTVEVPSQTCGVGGVNVEWRNLRQNDDCTWNVSVVTAAGTAVSDVERTSSETTVERRDTRKDTAQANSLQHVKVQDPAVATAEGHIWEQRSELRPDGLYDNTVTKRDEKQLASQVVEKRRTIRGTTVRTVNRNMPSAAADPSGIGAVVNTVTDSGRITQEITEVDRNAQPVDAGSACSTTVFEHVESDRTVQPTKPPKHWQAAGGGHRYERTSRITEEGSYEVTAEDRQELQRTSAKVTLRKTLRGTQRTVVDRNVASPLAETGLAVGEMRDSEVTPGGLYVTTKTVTTAEAAGTVGTECQKTIFEHTDSTTSNQAAQPSAEADEAGNGRTRRKSARQTEEGTWDVVTVTTEEKTQQAATKSWRKTLRGTQETTVDRNAVAALNGTGLKVGETRSSEKTPGGRYNNTTVAVTADAAGDIGTDCQKTVFEHVDSTTTNVADKPAAEADEAGNGTIRRKTARETEEGTWDVTVQTTTEKPQANATQTWRKTLRGTQATVVSRNASVALDGSGLSVGETRSSELTPGGLYNNTTVTVTADAAGEIGSECRQTVFEHVDSTTENQQDAPTGHATSAGGGKTYQRTARQTEEGTWDVVTVTTEEKTQQAATKSWRKTLRGVQQTTVDRNATTALTSAGLQLGETRTSEMTSGGRYNNTTVTTTAETVGTIGEECDDQTSSHTDVTTSNVAAKPDVMHQSASVNRTVSKSARTTEEGTWDVTTRTVTYRPSTGSGSAGSAGYTDSVEVGINATSVSGGAGGVNREVTLSMSPNDHGSYSYTKHERTYNSVTNSATAGAAGYSDTVTVGAHVTSVPSGSGGTNKEVTLSMSPNDHGSYSYTKHERTYNPVTNSATAGAAGYSDTVTVGAHVTSVPSGSGGVNKEVSLSMSPNDHGSYSYTKHERTYNSVTNTVSVTGGEYTDTVTVGAHVTSVSSSSGGVNEEVSLSMSPNDHGSFSFTKHVRSYRTRMLRAQTSHTRFLTRTTVTTVNSNADTAGIGGGIGSQATISSNGHGGSVVTESTVALEAYDSGWITWRSVRKNLQGDWYFDNGLRVFRNQLSVPTPSSNHNIELSFDVNEFGRFDGRMSYSDMDRNSFRRYTADWLNGDATGGERNVTVFGKTYAVQLRSFFGTGNEQAEALQRVNSIFIPGLSLPGRTYVVSAREISESSSST